VRERLADARTRCRLAYEAMPHLQAAMQPHRFWLHRCRGCGVPCMHCQPHACTLPQGVCSSAHAVGARLPPACCEKLHRSGELRVGANRSSCCVLLAESCVWTHLSIPAADSCHSPHAEGMECFVSAGTAPSYVRWKAMCEQAPHLHLCDGMPLRTISSEVASAQQQQEDMRLVDCQTRHAHRGLCHVQLRVSWK
jgi:hypothetical protein